MFIFWRWGGGGGVGWGNVATSTTGYVFLHFHTYVMLRCWTFSCTSTPASCCAAGRSLALPHIRHALLLDVLSCYAAGHSLAKKGTFPRSSRDTKIQVSCGKTLDFPIVRRRFHGFFLTTNLLKNNKNVQMTTVLDNSTIIL